MRFKLNISCFAGIFLIVLLMDVSLVWAQEVLLPSVTNQLVIENGDKVYLKNSKAIESVELPFFDDFSEYYFQPNPLKWADNYVFINGTYPINPPSLGVATFDAVDNNGNFYDNAGFGNSFGADTLSSNPINLNYPSDGSIFLSFYYQPQGIADSPEEADSLFLDFFAPELNVWNNVWKIPGSALTDFKQVMIQVSDQVYLKDGFRFRFHNKASLSTDIDPSKAVNVDHWNIDYVYLNRGRNINDTVYHDIAFVYPMKSLLKNYESMPWRHFITNSSMLLKTNVSSFYKNNDNVNRLIDSIYYVFYDNNGSEPNDTLFGGSYDREPNSQVEFNPPFVYPFLTNAADSASFNIKARFITDGFDPTINNEVLYVQKFYDYYAYDDGSAEAGYGLTGDGAQNAQLACKFNCVKEDTLNAIQFYFTKSLYDNSQKYFYLTIWEDNNGVPGKVIYKRQGVKPEYENELNKFHTYYIDDTTIVISGNFYVGWIQTTSDLLNLGFDFNRNYQQNNFYNINGVWENSRYEGALMIRPFFGKQLTTQVIPFKSNAKTNVNIYPNPAADEIFIRFENPSDYQQIVVSIYNISGKLVLQTNYLINQPINLSGLKEGVYIIRLTDRSRQLNYSQKIIRRN